MCWLGHYLNNLVSHEDQPVRSRPARFEQADNGLYFAELASYRPAEQPFRRWDTREGKR